MNISLIICIITGILICLSVIFKPEIRVGKIRLGSYFIVSLAGAFAILVSGALPLDALCAGLTENSEVNPLKILVLFLSMTFLSVYLDELGFFEFLAKKALSKTGNSQIKLFIKLYAVVSILTVFTSNDIIILTFTPFICHFTKSAKIDPTPYLFGEFFAANTWSMCLIIGNPTNIYLATFSGINFFDYLKTMALPTLLAGGVSLAVTFLLFKKQLSVKIESRDSAPVRLNKTLTVIGVVHLVVCIILLSVSSYIGIEMWTVTLCLALSLCACTVVYKLTGRSDRHTLVKSLSRLPYGLVPFLISMFVIVLSLSYSGVTQKAADLLCRINPVFSVGVTGFFVANVINNIPMSVLYASVLSSPVFAGSAGGVYAAIIGSNLGAYFTPVGALAGIMWLSILKKSGVDISFGKFVKYGAASSLPALAASLIALNLIV